MALSKVGGNQIDTVSGDLTVDTNTLVVDAAGNRVMIGTTTEGSAGADELTVGSTSGSNGITIRGGTTGTSSIYMSDATSGAGEYAGYIAYSHNSDSMAIAAAGGQRIRIDADGLKFGSDTAAANALDDYEEGTWTPTVGGTATYTTQEGHYTKIGDLVHARCTIVINSIGSGATTNISGLPFTCKSGTNGMGQINVGYWSNFKTNTIAPGGFVAAATTTVYFTGSDASASSVDYPFDFIQNGTRIDYDLTYRI